MQRGNHQSADDDTLYLSPEARELLRQVLRVQSLEGETELVSAVKEALRLQYSRGFHEGVAEGHKGAGLPPTEPAPRDSRRSLSSSIHHNSLSSHDRRKRRRQRRFRQRLRHALVTMVMLVLAGAALLAINAARPDLSANNERARHRIEFGR